MFVRRVAQAALGLPFVYLGYQAAKEPGGRVAAAAELGIPEPELMVRVNGAAMAVGGAALALNVLPRWAAAGLIASLVPTTLAGHAYWEHDDAGARGLQRVQFLKNLGLAGGLLGIVARR
ncbi:MULTISPECIES: DoxX family membrane protein [unclassified Pseudactinotalea]|uniref:DoxX family membrane protein n=1 Tax=unclassified Pseudactinotalea TaxID=2649176 RepID=UPI00128AEE20|nr:MULTISPECIES: DoxX family membrane protein [unclassified Pseudactinotalea]MPV51393.1 DoxX family membrane protein [Pseudactinotalea sp. HY160]QGH70604.1 DoxX family membrane protein [Pseudactinotalea sp. HY158]